MFNKHAAHAQVFGHPYAKYSQGGIYYNARYEELADLDAGVVVECDIVDAEPSPEPVEIIDDVVVEDEKEEEIKEENRLEDLHWRTIKKRVEEAGGIYKDKEMGILYLRGLAED